LFILLACSVAQARYTGVNSNFDQRNPNGAQLVRAPVFRDCSIQESYR
jgi:hypothetical protein